MASTRSLELVVPGMHCAGCIGKVERGLKALPGVTTARANLSTKRVTVAWDGDGLDQGRVVDAVRQLGFEATPFQAGAARERQREELRELVRALAVAAFASMNIMLLAVAVWAGLAEDMDVATRTMFYWIQAIIAIPTVAYSGRPFYRSALRALKAKSLNMDVPISLAVILTPLVSVMEVIREEEHAYFDGAVMLLFFLLIGRVLERVVRTEAWGAAENLLSLQATEAQVMEADGRVRSVPAAELAAGMTVLVAAGARVPADGTVADGSSDIDLSLVTGESVPETAGVGTHVYAGTLNLTGPLTVTVTARPEDSLLADLIRLMEAAEQNRSRYVQVADRLSRIYAPAVHVLAAVTFTGWLLLGQGWHDALMAAVAVLIITCPCALGLAMPVVQVTAIGRLLKMGIVVKAADALERLSSVDTLVFDKTGTLTIGQPALANRADIADDRLALAAALARASRHPLSRAVVVAAANLPLAAALTDVREQPGFGLEGRLDGQLVRLGSADWTGAPDAPVDGPHLWLRLGDTAPLLFTFHDRLREDAREVFARLKASGREVILLSGDRSAVVAQAAAELGVDRWFAEVKPADKAGVIARLSAEGHRVLMVGDGLNDAPALKAAQGSMSPASAADIAQRAADVVFQGAKLRPVEVTLSMARAAHRRAIENFGLAIGYNVIAVPLAMLGQVTPLIAAIAMSSSSIIVVINALGLKWRRL